MKIIHLYIIYVYTYMYIRIYPKKVVLICISLMGKDVENFLSVSQSFKIPLLRILFRYVSHFSIQFLVFLVSSSLISLCFGYQAFLKGEISKLPVLQTTSVFFASQKRFYFLEVQFIIGLVMFTFTQVFGLSSFWFLGSQVDMGFFSWCMA